MLGGLPDPVNLIPFGGGLAAAGKTANAGLRTALLAGARAGAVEGAAGALATDAIVFPSLSARGEDLGFSDLSLDAAMGAALGGLLGAAGAGLHRYLSGRRRGNVPTDGRTAPPQASFDAVPDRVSFRRFLNFSERKPFRRCRARPRRGACQPGGMGAHEYPRTRPGRPAAGL